MGTHSRTLTWKILWTEEPGELQSMGSPRVGHDWATNTHTHLISAETDHWEELRCGAGGGLLFPSWLHRPDADNTSHLCGVPIHPVLSPFQSPRDLVIQQVLGKPLVVPRDLVGPWHSHCRALGSILVWKTKIPHALQWGEKKNQILICEFRDEAQEPAFLYSTVGLRTTPWAVWFYGSSIF